MTEIYHEALVRCKTELSIRPLGDLIYCCELFINEIMQAFTNERESILASLINFWKLLFDELTALKYEVVKAKYQFEKFWLEGTAESDQKKIRKGSSGSMSSSRSKPASRR